MVEGDADRMAEMPEGSRKGTAGSRPEPGIERQTAAATEDKTEPRTDALMEEVVRKENVERALKRVQSNKGAPGVDGMTVEDLPGYLGREWARIRGELLEAAYVPSAVRRVEIPKPNGGTRALGIPTVVDRLVAQAILQVLTPIFDPGFSGSSHGFRTGHSTHQAVEAARNLVREGYDWVVDLDVKQFFDRVNHDILMSRVARRVKDKRVLLVLRRYLTAGIMEGGLVSPMAEGTPQGSPLSPLLSNIYLDDLDRELAGRGLRFVRYADDCNVYVRSLKAGERVMASVMHFLEKKLKLKVNPEKSAVDRPWKRKFLGYSVTNDGKSRLKPAPQSVRRAKDRIRALTGRAARGRNIERVIKDLNGYLRGWGSYYAHAEVTWVFEELDSWVRTRLRKILWRQWKQPATRQKRLVALGLTPGNARRAAWNGRGPWWNATARHMRFAVPIRRLAGWGLLSLSARHRSADLARHTVSAGPVRPRKDGTRPGGRMRHPGAKQASVVR